VGPPTIPPPISPPVSPPPVNPPGNNIAPVANNDAYTVVHDRQLDVQASNGLLANDSDNVNDAMGIVVVTSPSNGDIDFQTVSMSGDGSFSYLPKSGFVGTDTFCYRVYDNQGFGNVATVSIRVTNTAPEAVADEYSTNEGQPLDLRESVGGNAGGLSESQESSLGLLANDTDPDGDALGAVVVGGPSHGQLVLSEDGTFIYTPNVNFAGTDTFTYSITDGIISTSPVTVTMTVVSGGPFDIDGRDEATLTPWMSEPDETAYGLGVSVGHPATIHPRVYDVPSGMSIIRRKIIFNPNVLSVGGNSTGSLTLSASGSNESISVAAVTTNFDPMLATIWYEIEGFRYDDGPFNMGFVSRIHMQVVEKKAVLESIKFTSTHEKLHRNATKNDYRKAGELYKPEWTSTKNGLMTQTRHTKLDESKVELTLNFTVAAGLAGKEVEIIGDSDEMLCSSNRRNSNCPWQVESCRQQNWLPSTTLAATCE
jgi:hypothetical protein